MRRAALALFGLMVLLLSVPGAAARVDASSASHTERVARLRLLNPLPGPATFHLAESASVVEVPPGLGFLGGAEARQFMRLTQGVDHPRVEAIVIGGRRGFVFVEWFASGYVSTADWDALDPARLMAAIKQATAEANARRRTAGVGEIEVVGWSEPPRLIGGGSGDGVRWAISAVEGGQTTINATVLKLGRRGYQRFTWVGTGAGYGLPESLLDGVVAGHRYEPGYGYRDRAAADAVAPFGIAALVAAAAGGTAAPDNRGAAASVGIALSEAWPVLLVALGCVPWGASGAARFTLGRAACRRFLSAAVPRQHKEHDHRRDA